MAAEAATASQGPVAGPAVVLATNNASKLTELRRVVAAATAEVAVLGLAEVAHYPEPAETERTFEGNALLKARACVAATGLPALADDSGLEVEELNQMPGVRSARWAGLPRDDAANNALLLRQLEDVPAPRRAARFVCAMAFVRPDGTEQVTRGVLEGELLIRPRGAGGFGYDPIFRPRDEERSLAELSAADKDALSHRGRAVRAIVPVVVETLTTMSPTPFREL